MLDIEDDSLLDALDEELDGVNIRQLGVGVGDTVPVGTGVGVSVVLAVVVGVGVHGSIDDEDKLELKPLLELALLSELLELDSALELKPALELVSALELKPVLELRLLLLELRPKLADELLLLSPSELELLNSLEVELPSPVGVSVPFPAAPALGPQATTSAAITTKTAKQITNLFIFLLFFWLFFHLWIQPQGSNSTVRRPRCNPPLRRSSNQGMLAAPFPLGRNAMHIGFQVWDLDPQRIRQINLMLLLIH